MLEGVETTKKKGMLNICNQMTACLSSAAKLAWSQRSEKKCTPRDRGRKLEHRAVHSGCFCPLFSSFSIQNLHLMSAVLARWKI